MCIQLNSERVIQSKYIDCWCYIHSRLIGITRFKFHPFTPAVEYKFEVLNAIIDTWFADMDLTHSADAYTHETDTGTICT